jgi:hypothetical protein
MSGRGKNIPPSPSVETTQLIFVTSSPNATQNTCPIPILIFNDTLEITKLGRWNGMRIMGHNTLTGSEAGTVPLGGIIYHGAGFTRIFDSTGKQILFINDSESVGPVPAGYSVPVSYIIQFTSGDMYSKSEGVTRIYQEGYDTCIATILQGPGAFKAPPVPPH